MNYTQIVEAEQYHHPDPIKMEGIRWRPCTGTHCHINEDIDNIVLDNGSFLIKENDGKLRVMKAERFKQLFKLFDKDGWFAE